MNTVKFLTATALLFFVFIHKPPSTDVEWSQWATLVILGSLLLVRSPLIENLPVKLFYLYTAFGSLMWGLWRDWTETLFNKDILIEILQVRMYALIESLETLVIAIGFLNWKKIRELVAWALFFGGLLHCCDLIYDQMILQVTYDQVIHGYEIGLMGNRSIGATFAAMWVFFALEWMRNFDWKFAKFFPIAAFIGVVGVCCSNSGISYIGLAAGAIAICVIKKYWRAIGIIFTLAGCAYPFVAPRLFMTNMRYDIWPIWLQWWYGSWSGVYWTPGHFNPLFGSGGGTARYWGPYVQIKEGFKTNTLLLFAHNDWLQILLEHGLVGLVLGAWVFGMALKRVWGRPILFGRLVCFGICAFGNYPLRVAPTALLALWLFGEAYNEVI